MPKREIPPFMWQVWFKGNKKPMEMSGFDEEHIRLMCGPGKVVKVKIKTSNQNSLFGSIHKNMKAA